MCGTWWSWWRRETAPIRAAPSVTCWFHGKPLIAFISTYTCVPRGLRVNASIWTRRRPGKSRRQLSGPTAAHLPTWHRSSTLAASSRPRTTTVRRCWPTSGRPGRSGIWYQEYLEWKVRTCGCRVISSRWCYRQSSFLDWICGLWPTCRPDAGGVPPQVGWPSDRQATL